MSFPFITAEQRLAEKRGSKGVILGPSGVGKTTLLKTADAARTLFIDLEAGDLAVLDWPGDSVRPRTWQECRDLACYIGGPNPALRDDQSYSQAHYDQVCALYGDPAMLAKYSLIFVDSITVAGRLCLQWAKGQPQAFSEKTGKPDTLGAHPGPNLPTPHRAAASFIPAIPPGLPRQRETFHFPFSERYSRIPSQPSSSMSSTSSKPSWPS